MIGDLFDSPWKILIVAVVIIVLFGSRKLPDAARSLGRSMRILKAEVGSLHEDESVAGTPVTAHGAGAEHAQITAASGAGGQQAQIDALQQQIRDMQRAATMDPAPADAQRTPQPR